jgi:hypothetical protein
MTRNRVFTTDGSGGGILEWEELVVRKGFRPRWVKRRVRKEPYTPTLQGVTEMAQQLAAL